MIKTLLVVLLLGLAGAASMTLTPASHNFGKMVVHGSVYQMFKLTGTSPATGIVVPKVQIVGRDAGDFVVDSSRTSGGGSLGNPGPTVLQSSCLGGYTPQSGPCEYKVVFTPQDIGIRTAQLVVTDNGQTATATLTGEGIFGCRANWVPCNYSDFYSGTFQMHSADVAPAQPSGTYNSGTWDLMVTVNVIKGQVTCTGAQDDTEMEFDSNFMSSKGTAKGPILGPGLFAIEVLGSGSSAQYRISAACPTPHLTTTADSYVLDPTSGVPKVVVTSATSTVPARPVSPKDKFFTDLQPVIGFFSLQGVTLSGNQSDLHDTNAATNDHVTGVSTMTWILKRW